MCPHEFYLGTCTCIKLFETIYCINGPHDEKISKFFWPKKIGQGGSLGKGVWEPTPHLL